MARNGVVRRKGQVREAYYWQLHWYFRMPPLPLEVVRFATPQWMMSAGLECVYTVYRRCQNWEVGDVLFEGEPLLWFDSLAAARVVYNESGHQARDCLVKEFEIIRRNESLEFTSAYTWATSLLGVPRKRGEALPAARERIEHELRSEEDRDISERFCAAVIASDGGRIEPVYGARAQAEVKPVDLDDELEQLADWLS